MFKPPPYPQNPGSYEDLYKRIIRHIQQNNNEKIMEILQRAFETALEKESIMLSRPERSRLYQEVSKAVLTGLLENIP